MGEDGEAAGGDDAVDDLLRLGGVVGDDVILEVDTEDVVGGETGLVVVLAAGEDNEVGGFAAGEAFAVVGDGDEVIAVGFIQCDSFIRGFTAVRQARMRMEVAFVEAFVPAEKLLISGSYRMMCLVL